jgi:hypothetical protein
MARPLRPNRRAVFSDTVSQDLMSDMTSTLLGSGAPQQLLTLVGHQIKTAPISARLTSMRQLLAEHNVLLGPGVEGTRYGRMAWYWRVNERGTDDVEQKSPWLRHYNNARLTRCSVIPTPGPSATAVISLIRDDSSAAL